LATILLQGDGRTSRAYTVKYLITHKHGRSVLGFLKNPFGKKKEEKVPPTQQDYELDKLGRETAPPEGFIPSPEQTRKEEKHAVQA
jgi:hypothetical protein